MKKITAALVLTALCLSLAACSAPTLSDKFDEDEVIGRSKQMVSLLNQFDYEAVVSEFREDLQAQLSAEELESALDETLVSAGAFKSVSSSAAYSQQNDAANEEYATCVLVCDYESAKLTFTISMDEELDIVGLYMK